MRGKSPRELFPYSFREGQEEALENPLLDVDISDVDEALINIVGGPDMSLAEAETATREVSGELTSGAEVVWGAQIREELEGTMRAMVIVPGVESPWAEGAGGG